MRTRSMNRSAETTQKFGGNGVKIETVADCSLDLFPSSSEFEELATTIKVENYNEKDVDLVANAVKSELIEFHSNQPEGSFLQNDVKTILLEKIPKIETEILDDEPLSSCTDKEDDPYNFQNYCVSDLNFDPDPDPESDPFGDVDCDPSFSQNIQIHNNSKNDSTTQIEPKYAAHINDGFSGISYETRFHGSVKSSLLTANPTQYDRMRVTGDSKFRCQLCLETRHSKTWLKTHLETCAKTHKNRRRFCVPCNKLFTHSDGRRMHYICIHEIKDAELHNVGKIKRSAKKLNQQLPYQCQFCVCAFTVVQLLVAHLASHPEVNATDEEDLKQKPYRCQECPSAFRYYRLYTLHMLSHKNERAFKCPMPNCKHAFKTKGNLTNHLRRIHSEEKPFKCPEPNCGKAFTMKNMLQRHSVVHSEDRPFKCFHSDCYRTFKTKVTLKKHFASHTEARRLKHMTRTFKCPERGCFAAFTIKYNLNFHIKQKHKNNNYPAEKDR